MPHTPTHLRVSPDGRFFQDQDGAPFFYLADTVWMLFNRLTRDEIKTLFNNREAKGFTAIQAVLFRDLFEPNSPNVAGLRPFASEADMKAVRLNPAWMDWVKDIVALAGDMGLMMALLPTWGDKWNEHSNSAGPVIMDRNSAREYGRFLSDRLASHRNIIWILGGDSPIRNVEHLDILNAMGEGIRDGGSKDRLISYHASGGASSDALHAASWLDFHSLQSGHYGLNADDYVTIERLSRLAPRKPCLNMEPNYEVSPMFHVERSWGDKRPYHPVFSAYDVRKCLYRSVLAGAAGFTYGCDPIRQCLRPGDRIHAHPGFSEMPMWNEVLDAEASGQLHLLPDILRERSYVTRTPAQELLCARDGTPLPPDSRHNAHSAAHIRVARCGEGRYLMAYIPVRQDVTLDTRGLTGERFRVTLYDPEACRATQEFDWDNSGTFTCVPGRDLDTLLVIDAD